MSKLKSSILLLAMLFVTFAIVAISFRNEAAKVVMDEPQKEQVSESAVQQANAVKTQASSAQPSATQSQPAARQTSHSQIGVGHNPAARFFDLPLEQQREILELSARNSDAENNYDVREVEPGVFSVLNKNGPRVVPVAVINEDGTVSIHEY